MTGVLFCDNMGFNQFLLHLCLPFHEFVRIWQTFHILSFQVIVEGSELMKHIPMWFVGGLF